MNNWIIICLAVFIVSLILTGIIIPQILLIAFRKKLFDEPDARKIHHGVIPRLGGIAFMPSIIFSISLIIGLGLRYHLVSINSLDFGLPVVFGLCSIFMLFLVGLADDLIGVKYRAKFIVQIIASIFFVLGGIALYNLHGLLFLYEIPNVLAWFITILVVVYITNAINLIDGIDGLASGLSAVCLTVYGVLFFTNGYYIYSVIAFSTLGTLVPFFYYNVFGNPQKQKKIFMGDTGALTIGIILSFLSLLVNACNISLDEGVNPAVLAFSPLILPCFDVVRVYIHRIRAHRNPFLADKSHIHHKFLALGIPQRVTMILILVLAIAFIFFNIILSPYINITILVLIDILVYTVGNILLTKAIRRRERIKNIQTGLYE
ncbi:MAG: undecaprenyl/decaprenyl-phosphate alpha-N-acetylglucosaminyl 1-phosphate transferase [Bacteroides sp.]|nr:undecaprenyl/decaprenyl-phosphate alpha-N-acetylglucosaminyl 1-phosphate transferase [Bacteroidales bacterium]MBD5379841.1 undecaprenyl/decaprenyl-phosphate alpha-N-acetylglucosaminyl 1-phosphate transferase [Bacteroides sp.]MDE5809751.1 undecaprenyl/decaprenyl-phosphate alpha-N-acetylglucosaminyl 1-phosphate transferase [Muribaculaceae bacterium]MDE6224527.1 undecaprenyl/decaprenyl-phosphate alpha-N-acetylglucosaminyl 1-phosphate transferase [Muribaculaceae bacterium]